MQTQSKYEEKETPYKKRKSKRKYAVYAKLRKNAPNFLKDIMGTNWYVWRKYSSKKARYEALKTLKKAYGSYKFKI